MKPTALHVLALVALPLALACGGSDGGGGNQGGSGGSSGGSGGSAGGSGGSGGSSAGAGGSAAGAGGSAAGSGGSAAGAGGGMAGAGGMMGSPDAGPSSEFCMTTAVGAGTEGLIDNFEDGDAMILANDGRTGPGWWVSMSATTMVTVPMLPMTGGAPIPVDGGAPGSPMKALHLVGTESTMGNAGWGADATATIVLDSMKGCYDASAYSGVKLSMKGKAGSKVFVYVFSGVIRPLAGQTAGHYRKEVTLTEDWQDITIPWAEFGPGWGAVPDPKMLNPKETYAVSVGTAPGADGSVGEFDFWIDDLSFYK